jgi:hypothetical protein
MSRKLELVREEKLFRLPPAGRRAAGWRPAGSRWSTIRRHWCLAITAPKKKNQRAPASANVRTYAQPISPAARRGSTKPSIANWASASSARASSRASAPRRRGVHRRAGHRPRTADVAVGAAAEITVSLQSLTDRALRRRSGRRRAHGQLRNFQVGPLWRRRFLERVDL